MVLHRESLLINLVADSGISNWYYMRYQSNIRLCPFFWQVLFSLLLFPLRPLFHWREDMFKKFTLAVIIFCWGWFHFYYFHVFLLVFYLPFNSLPIWDWAPYLNGKLEWFALLIFTIEILLVGVILLGVLMTTAMFLLDEFALRKKRLPKPLQDGEDNVEPVKQKTWGPFEFLQETLALCRAYLKAQKEKLCPIIEVQE